MSSQFIQIQLASPNEIARWSQRTLPTGEIIGEVLKADTINYRTFKPERGGLFCEKIFGSTVNGECSCGKTKLRQNRATPLEGPVDEDSAELPDGATPKMTVEICRYCNIEPTDSKVRRYRMGRITLGKPVAHMWYFKNTPNALANLLPMKAREITDVIYLAEYSATLPSAVSYGVHPHSIWAVNQWKEIASFCAGEKPLRFREKPAPWNKAGIIRRGGLQSIENCGAQSIETFLRAIDLVFLERVLTAKFKHALRTQAEKGIKHEIRDQAKTAFVFAICDTEELLDCSTQDPRDQASEPYFAEVDSEISRTMVKSQEDVDKLFNRKLDLTKYDRTSQKTYGMSKAVRQYAKRLRVVRGLLRKNIRPEWMIITLFPVLPPDLRPMIQMSSGRFAAADMNDLYRRLIYRKIRFDKFIAQFDPEYLPDLLIRHDVVLLQEAADAIIDNGRLAKPMMRANRTLFKSLTAVIEGKQGRFRQNLLGKRVDYSGRSVIVVGPKLRLHQCGLPREMALELFQPFVIRALLAHTDVTNIRAAKNLIHRRTPLVWETLETVVHGHPILLNRAPTLHRLGIQAFEPILLPGRAIQLHPLVCPAFNADFDGDQMAVHIPLSLEAQAEARLLMLATHNWLSPATGEPSILPSQDMILGFYYLTAAKPQKPQLVKKRPQPKKEKTINQGIFSNFGQVLQSFSLGQVQMHDWIWVRWNSGIHTDNPEPLQIILSPSGRARTVYKNYIMEHSALETGKENPTDFITVPSMKSAVSLPLVPHTNADFFIRTTPGRVIFNNLLYENLFL